MAIAVFANCPRRSLSAAMMPTLSEPASFAVFSRTVRALTPNCAAAAASASVLLAPASLAAADASAMPAPLATDSMVCTQRGSAGYSSPRISASSTDFSTAAHFGGSFRRAYFVGRPYVGAREDSSAAAAADADGVDASASPRMAFAIARWRFTSTSKLVMRARFVPRAPAVTVTP